MQDSIKTNHVEYNGKEGKGKVEINGIIIPFNRIIPAGDQDYLTLALNYKVTSKIKISKYPSVIKEINKVNTFIGNYQYCYG